MKIEKWEMDDGLEFRVEGLKFIDVVLDWTI